MALAKALTELERTAKASGGKAFRGLHLKYLEAYDEHASEPSERDVTRFLRQLRQARSQVATERAATATKLLRWEREVVDHPGFAKFRSQLEQRQLRSGALAQIYGNLRRMNLHADADRLWPRLELGRMAREDVLQIWATCPANKLPELDAATAKVLNTAKQLEPWQLLSALSRAGNLPPQSATLKACTARMAKLVEDFEVSPKDIAKILARLHVASGQDGSIDPAIERIKQELVARNSQLDAASICGLLPSLTEEDALWPKLRDQLLQLPRLPLPLCLDVLAFLKRIANGPGDRKLKDFVARRVEVILSTGQADVGEVALTARRIEVVAAFGKVCQALLNSAINLRQDLYPAVLWRFFVRAGEAGLAEKHPFLLAKFEKIGSVLESHGIPQGRMSLDEMLKAARAMRQNGVRMPQSCGQMAEIYLTTWRRVEQHAGGQVADPGAAEEAADVQASPEAAPEEVEGDVEPEVEVEAEAEVIPRAVDGDLETSEVGLAAPEPGEMLAEVHRLVVEFWAELLHLGHEHEELAAAAVSICEPGGCKLGTRTVADCLPQLASLPTAAAAYAQLLSGLEIQLPKLSNSELLSLPLKDPAAAALVVKELESRTMEDGLQVVPEDAVQLTRFLAELPRNGDATVRALAEKLSELLLELPSSRLLPAVCVALLELGGRPPGAERLRKGLRQLVAEGPAETPALVYALAALHEGRLPFALVGYAWALAARCETASEEERLKLWAFALAARHLSSASAWTSLRLAPNAAALEGLHHLEDGRPLAFPLASTKATQVQLRQLQVALSAALPAQLVEPRFQVPGTPYVVDFALQPLKLGILLPRPAHLLGDELNGHAKLMEAILKAMGWRLLWVWPTSKIFQASPDEAALAALAAAVEGRPSPEAAGEVKDEALSEDVEGADGQEVRPES